MIPHKQKLHSKDIKQAKKKKKTGIVKGGFLLISILECLLVFLKRQFLSSNNTCFSGRSGQTTLKKATFAKTSKYGVHMSCSIPFNSISSQTEMCRKLGCVFQNMKENLIPGHCPHPVLLKPVYLGHAY